MIHNLLSPLALSILASDRRHEKAIIIVALSSPDAAIEFKSASEIDQDDDAYIVVSM